MGTVIYKSLLVRQNINYFWVNFAQWRYSNQWSNREVLLLLVENCNQYPAQTEWNISGWGNFWRLLREQICEWILRTSDFNARMSGIKLWKGHENIRIFYKKKPFFKILSGCLHSFWTLKVHRKYALTLLWDENFFSLNRSKYPSFYTDFKNFI